MNKIKKGDEVVVIAGKDKGKRGTVTRVLPGDGKIVVENINMVKRHTKGNPLQGTPGGIVEKEMPIEASNVAIWNPVTNKPDRIGFRFLEDGRKVRYFKSNDEVVDI
ncbi:MAG TPA: 50S ribosomal protein L24 [Gammaproteobacteria bacterium]|nr:50S ribosomal protein L24 [Gammaproteobacteria bacterium]